ncbi:fructosamine kinase family protein [Caviibacterium pharyngocola]|uniref:Fructosamine kinase family protein n=1 Tax=Caviibacterium pharyngocola TaxID=28159 RepID=A0A2M8RSN6_9PAST|nr:fructosamine kinase family protein [Caviibacterium pharyngocola]PJG81900.1 fructosamine kinase family protein [Caviibacterium pharyngocola]
MWKSVSQVLADQFGAYYSIKEKANVHTGEMHEAWVIDDGIQPVFVKVNGKNFRSMFRTEADQLALLAKTNTVNVPQVYGVGCSHSHSFLLLEAFRFTPPSAQAMAQFGTQLARLHSFGQTEHYGLDFDTWLGPLYQPNEWKDDWAKFFSEQRIGWQLQICKEKNLDFGDIKHIIAAVQERLAKHQPKPALLHGNLWIENCAQADERIVTYDPACYWGDRECDIAFSELFEPFPAEFYENYHRTYPLEEGYDERKLVYQLYYLLNFSCRFHGNYVELTKTFISRLLKENQ